MKWRCVRNRKEKERMEWRIFRQGGWDRIRTEEEENEGEEMKEKQRKVIGDGQTEREETVIKDNKNEG